MGLAMIVSTDAGSAVEWAISLAVVGVIGLAGVLGEVMRRQDLRRARESEEQTTDH